MERLYTIGYEGPPLAAFIATLRQAGVDCLVDVRERPVSRKPGFSREPLREALAAAGIAYRHERALGAPRPLRTRVRTDRDYGRFFEDYARHLRTQAPRLDALAGELTGCVALMCYERDPGICHRTAVAAALQARTGLTPAPLTVAS